jgi:multiple sugar transport system permease protein
MHSSVTKKINIPLVLGIVAFLLIVLFPLYWLIVSSLKTQSDILAGTPQIIPSQIIFDNYRQVWESAPLLKYFRNSIIITIPAMILAVILAMISGYAFSRFNFPGKKLFGFSIILTQLFPSILFLLPYFLMFSFMQHQPLFRNLNIVFIGENATYWNFVLMIFTYTSFILPFCVYLMRSFYDSIPNDIEEAAMVDGCTPFQAFYKVIIPLILPAIATVAILAFLQCWNEVLFASVLTNSTTRSVAQGIRDYRTQTSVSWNLTLTAGVIVTIPVIIFFTFLQKRLVAGLTAGAVKG